MINVRRNVFETNSSSTHSIAIGLKSDMEAWKEGKFYYLKWSCSKLKDQYKEGDFIPSEYVHERFDADFEANGQYYDDFDSYVRDEYNLCTYMNWNTDHEEDYNYYTTPNGEDLMIRCYYGYDG